MKTFKEFCVDANIQENWFQDRIRDVRSVTNRLGLTKPTPPTPKPVLAYRNYRPGILDKTSGKFTQRAHTPKEQERYGWRPVTVSSYSKADTPGSRTASGERFDDTQRLVAVPYASRSTNEPSVPFGTRLRMTRAPGTGSPVATTRVSDTGNFGPAGDYNRQTKYDLALQTARDVSGNPNITSLKFGKQKVYVQTIPPVAKTTPSRKK